MKFFEVIEKRCSTRAFLDKKISEDKLKQILETAVKAPSAGNLQAYRIKVVDGVEEKKAVAAACFGQDFVAQAPAVLIFFALPLQSEARYGQRGRTLYATQDATIAAAYAQLAATALGLSSCWVGAFDEEKLRQCCKAEKSAAPIAVIPVGHASERPKQRQRKPLKEIWWKANKR